MKLMAAAEGNKNAIGNSGGKSLNDRKLAAKVRSLTLGKIAEILERPVVKMDADDYKLYREILVKLAGTVLPRLNEHTGEEGGAIIFKPLLAGKSNVPSDDSTEETPESPKED